MSTAKPKKYIFVNGVMTKNPDFEKQQHSTGSGGKFKSHDGELAVISNSTDLQEAQALQKLVDPTLPPMEYVASTTASMNLFTSPAHQQQFQQANPLVQEHGGGGEHHAIPLGRDLLQELFDYFIIYEVPVGLVTKLLDLEKYRLNFMVDDSGSMMGSTDVTWRETCQFMQQSFPREAEQHPDSYITRIQEEENRLHVMMDILSYVAVQNIQIFFMNTDVTLQLSSHGKLPEDFRAEAHGVLRETFSKLRYGGTPTMKLLKRSLADAAQHSEFPTAHYLLTDGCPSDASSKAVGDVICRRASPDRNPMTLISCTNVDSEVEWMKDIEEVAPFCAEVDDYNDERDEVMKDQGKAFPYTKGMWLLSNLVAAMNPHDLDALDENVPFTKFTLDGLLGVSTSYADYDYYFKCNPHSHKYKDKFEQFLTVEGHADQIVPRQVRATRSSAGDDDSCCVVS